MTKEIKNSLEGRCRCGAETTFTHIGKMAEKDKVIELYVCRSCSTSIAENSIRKKCYLLKYDGAHCKELKCTGYDVKFCYTPEFKIK